MAHQFMGKQSRIKAEKRLIRNGLKGYDPPERGELPPWSGWAKLPEGGEEAAPELFERMVQDFMTSTGTSRENAVANIRRRTMIPHYQNSRYHVAMEVMDGVMHLDIRRRDSQPVGPERFRDFQRIKNELVGPEFEAAEIYPAESRLRDASNNYHLWVLPKGQRFPFGFSTRLVQYGSGEFHAQAPQED
jgi:hypothetical protein